MPDVFVYATPEAHEQLLFRLEELCNKLGEHLSWPLSKPPQNIIIRLIQVRALPNAANVHFEVTKTDDTMSDTQRREVQEQCICALQDMWRAFEGPKHVSGVKKVDGTATVSRGTWGKVWQETA